MDSGITTGDVITDAFDSMLAKLIVTGSDRQDAIEKARRALLEFEITGLPTVIPFHRKVLDEPSFIAVDAKNFAVHTRWIEEEFSATIEPWDGTINDGFDEEDRYRSVVVEVEGRRLKVGVPIGIFSAGGNGSSGKAPKRAKLTSSAQTGGGGLIVSPMQATVVKVAVEVGDPVFIGDVICVLEAMKMEQQIFASIDGTVKELGIAPGDTLGSGQQIGLLEPLD